MKNEARNTEGERVSGTRSLATFFSQTPTVDLDNCDKEQIHLSGCIQDEGAVLIVCQRFGKVVAATDNVASLLGAETHTVLGGNINALNSDLVDEIALLDVDQDGIHSVLDTQFGDGDSLYDAVVHGYMGNWVIEFLPSPQSDARTLRRHMRLVSKESGRIMSADTLEEALQIGCDVTRQITGFSRVKIYQFLPDWSGKVAAESREEHIESFLGLHFPDTDIPKQARALFARVPYRSIYSVNDATRQIFQHKDSLGEPIDSTFSLLRSVSPMHTTYLRNMGVEASFSISLYNGDKLWGLIACHNDKPGCLPFDMWASLRELGTALSSRIGFEASRDTSSKVLELRRIEVNLASELRDKGNLMEVVEEFGPLLMRFMNADGFAFQYGSELHCSGHTPPREFITNLIEWVQTEADEWEQYQTCSLHKQWQEAAQYKDSACGVLLQPVALHRTCQMVWFRRPVSETVTWAGAQEDKQQGLDDQGNNVLLPRNSFKAWVGEHNDFCNAWSDAEMVIAREILREILDILASVLILSEENSRLKSFAASAAAHDIKAPLRQIEMALGNMGEDEFDADSLRLWHEVASGSARVLNNVSTGILEYMSVPDNTDSFEEIDLKDVFSDVQIVMSAQLDGTDDSVSFDVEHSVFGERNLLTSLFLNLIGNSLKYSKPEKSAKVSVTSRKVDEQWVELSVIDNGLGIPDEFAEQIFNPSERLRAKEGVEGSGLGLSICRRIVSIHAGSIYVDTSVKDGARVVVRLPIVQP